VAAEAEAHKAANTNPATNHFALALPVLNIYLKLLTMQINSSIKF
jgi:hypothetical protein